MVVNMAWYQKEMTKKIEAIDWRKAAADVQRFLKPADVKTLALWNADLFLDRLQRLK